MNSAPTDRSAPESDESKYGLNMPFFKENEQKFLIDNLIMTIPHRKIAKGFWEMFPDFAPDMEYEAFEKAFLQRSYDYSRNKISKWYYIIRDGRREQKESIDHLKLTHKRYRVQLRAEVIESLEELEDLVDRKKIDPDRAKIKLQIILKKLTAVESFEKNERDEAKLAGRNLDAEDDDDGISEDDFKY